jgi:hypothetical protein
MADVLLQPIFGSVDPNYVIAAIIRADGFPPVGGKRGDIPANDLLSERSPTGARQIERLSRSLAHMKSAS